MGKMLGKVNRVIEFLKNRNFTKSNFLWEICSNCRHLLTGLRSRKDLDEFLIFKFYPIFLWEIGHFPVIF